MNYYRFYYYLQHVMAAIECFHSFSLIFRTLLSMNQNIHKHICDLLSLEFSTKSFAF